MEFFNESEKQNLGEVISLEIDKNDIDVSIEFDNIDDIDQINDEFNKKKNNQINEWTVEKKKNFVYNALESGWVVQKKENSYVFTKPHNKKKNVFKEKYLSNFIKENLN